MTSFPFYQVDVFGDGGFSGNPLAVVLDADGLDTDTMQRIAAWTGLSETTFIRSRQDNDGAGYAVRIFTQRRELPFAGHPTLGSCAAWLRHHRRHAHGVIRQSCAAGNIDIQAIPSGFSFKAPPLRRTGELDADTRVRVAQALQIEPAQLLATQWVDNGAGWCAVLLSDPRHVLSLTPHFPTMGTLKVGVVAPRAAHDGGGFEVRAFAPSEGVPEDPVTGNLQAGIAWWLTTTGRAPAAYLAHQGTVLGRRGRVHVRVDGNDIWIGGRTDIHIAGEITL